MLAILNSQPPREKGAYRLGAAVGQTQSSRALRFRALHLHPVRHFELHTLDPKPEKDASDKLRNELEVWSSAAAEEGMGMPKKGHSEEQILRALRQVESGTRVSEICREYGISDATFYIWKKKYAGLALSELRELRQLREENGKLKRLVADLSLDRHILQEIVQKKL